MGITLSPEEYDEYMENQTQHCHDELMEVLNDMKYALYFGVGGHALEHLIQWVLDKYPLDVRIEALTRVQKEIEKENSIYENHNRQHSEGHEDCGDHTI